MTTPARHRTGFIALLAVAVVLLFSASYAAAPAQSSTAFKRCGTFDSAKTVPLVDIRARGTSCKTARGVVKQWVINAYTKNCTTVSCRARSFTCTPSPKDKYNVLQDCRRSGARVPRILFTQKQVADCVLTRSCTKGGVPVP